MALGIDPTAFTGGLLTGINQQMSNNRNEQAKQDDYASQLAAKSTQAAKDQETSDRRDAAKQQQQTEAFARLLNNGEDPTPGHITAAHAYLTATGADLSKISEDPDTFSTIQEKLRPMAATINAKLQNRYNDNNNISPITGKNYATDTQNALGTTSIPTSGIAPVNSSDLQPNPAAQQTADAARNNVYQGSTTHQGMYPPLTSSNYNEDFISELSKSDPTRAIMAKQAVLGTLPTTSPRLLVNNKGQPTQLLKDAMQYDPNFNAEALQTRQQLSKDYVSGKGPNAASTRINSLNQLALHMKELADAGTALDNNDYLQPAAGVANYIQSKTNDPRLNNFNTIKSAASDEISRLFRAGIISDKEKESWDTNVNSSASPSALLGTPDKPGAIMTMAKLSRDSADTINDKWNTTFNQNVDWMTPRSRKALDYVLNGGNNSKQQGTDNAQQNSVQSQQPNGQSQQQPQIRQPTPEELHKAGVDPSSGTFAVINGTLMRKKPPQTPQQGNTGAQ